VTVELVLLPRVAYRGQEITGSGPRSLLALLADAPSTGTSTSRLVEDLWPEKRPDHPAKALQILVSRLRARLGPELIASTPTGYRLTLSPDQVDASAVRQLAESAERAARAGDHASALASAEAGIALCDGVAPDPTADPLAALRAARVPVLHALVRARALALARLGRPAEAVAPLRDLAAEHPRDEEVLAELLRCAPLPEALARYESYRRALRDELGSDPGPALRDVHRALLASDAPAVRQGVAEEPNAMLGRDKDVAAVADLLRTSRVVSIVGAGGLGKTRLANAVARHAEQRTVHVVALAGVAADADVAGEVGSALGARPAGSAHAILVALGPGAALLVLDN